MDEIRLLLVDDEDEFRQATATALAHRGFVVTEAESGERALEILGHDTPDAMVLDLRMEGLSGIETLTRLRGQHQDLPVVILTGHGGFEEALAGIQLNIVEFLQKPVEVEQLAVIIRKLLARGYQQSLRERSIGSLMVPLSSYLKVYDDQPVHEVIKVLRDALLSRIQGRDREQGHRTVLVYDRQERFVGVLRLNDLLELLLPTFLKDSPYASFFTGMFLAQCKVVGNQLVRELIDEPLTIDLHAPLMEALHLVVSKRIINLPVLDGGQLVGILRDKDLLFEMAAIIGGTQSPDSAF